MSVVVVVVGRVVVGGLGVGEMAFGGGDGAVVEGWDGAKSWSSSRRWLSAVKAPCISCCC